MSSNIRIETMPILQAKVHCKNTLTKYCSHTCNSRHYKQLLETEGIKVSDIETKVIGKLQTNITYDVLATKEILTILEASALLNVTHVTLRRWLKEKWILSSRIGKKHLIKREQLDNLLA